MALLPLAASASASKTPSGRTTAQGRKRHHVQKPRTTSKAAHRPHPTAARRGSARYRHSGARRRKTAPRNKIRFASIHMQPERAQQIQQALIQAGDLHEKPNGRWDEETREAMKLYQKQNGFAVTGLPDAKSLMKLGLGPHPLPPDADPIAQAKAEPPAAPAGIKASQPPSQREQPEN
jgi:hypothetical protein